ncbi:MAG: DUF3127 domain-containing protein [Saprospiraceae bacterium]
MQITGRLFKVLPAQTGEGKNGPWRRQDIILETDGQYPKKIVIGVWGDKMSHLPLNIGDMITADFDIDAREYNSKWYNDVRAWKVSSAGAEGNNERPGTGGSYKATPPQGSSSFPEAPPRATESFDDDLPF